MLEVADFDVVLVRLVRATQAGKVDWTQPADDTLTAVLGDGYDAELKRVPAFASAFPRPDPEPDHTLTLLRHRAPVWVIDRRDERLPGDEGANYARFKELWTAALKHAQEATARHLQTVITILDELLTTARQ